MGTGENSRPANMVFKSSPGMNWMLTPVMLEDVNFSAVSAPRLVI